MTVTRLRLIVQHLSFVVFTYGAHFRIALGGSIPCFSCPYVASCGGYCYLMILQRALGSMFVPLVTGGSEIVGSVSERMFSNLETLVTGFLLFAVLVVLLGKTWCGWICPFGLLQDWLTMLRKRLGIREAELSVKAKGRLSWCKYVLLAYLIFVPLLASTRLLPNEFILAFCNICPGKSLMPLFNGEYQHLALDESSPVGLVFSVLLLLITGGMLVGMFFKERFFCLFCPMLALNNLFRKLHFLRITKEPKACHGCGNCRRNCSMDNETVYRERLSCDVYDQDCMACFKCSESCAADGALKVKFGPFTLFSSGRSYASRLKK